MYKYIYILYNYFTCLVLTFNMNVEFLQTFLSKARFTGRTAAPSPLARSALSILVILNCEDCTIGYPGNDFADYLAKSSSSPRSPSPSLIP